MSIPSIEITPLSDALRVALCKYVRKTLWKSRALAKILNIDIYMKLHEL